MPSKPHHDLNQALQELASKNIQADPSHLVESIRRQFANPLEYVRELIANGLDAGATGIRVRGRWLEGEKYPLQIFFEDDGKGMGRAEVERYLTVFDSFKDGDGATVGRHGVGKLSPWADSHLGTYTVDTCDSKERTFLHMESVHQGVMRVYPAGDRPPGTTVTLAWRGRDAEELAFRMERVTKVAEEYCRYAGKPIRIEYRNHLLCQEESVAITHTPDGDGWVPLESVEIPGGKVKLWYRLGGGPWGVFFYQGGIRLCSDNSALSITNGTGGWEFPGLQLMADSQAFDVPISRNAVKRNEPYFALGWYLRKKVVPALVEEACRRLSREDMSQFREQDEDLTIAYLRHDFKFAPAKDIPLFPVFPFGKACVNQLNAWRHRQGKLCVCRIECGPLDAPPQAAADMLDARRLTFQMRSVLEAGLGPLQDVDFDKEVMVLSETSQQGQLSPLEARFQDCLTLRKPGMEWLMESDEEIAGLGARILDMAFRRLGKEGRGEKEISNERCAPEIPKIKFRLGRLVKMDGNTPATTRKFLQDGKSVVLNLFHPDLERHMRLAAKDPSLAAHWCLRELLLSGEVEQFRHLSQEVREALIQFDAAARCAPSRDVPERSGTENGRFKWSDDEEDLRNFEDRS